MIWEACTEVQARAGLVGAAAWNTDADCPDVLDLQDLLARPDLTAGSISRRRRDGTGVGRPRRFDYPKPTGSMRHLVWLDSLAQFDFRLLAGAAVSAIEAHLGHEVRRYRTLGSGAGWIMQPWRDAYYAFDQSAEEHRADERWFVELMLDVRRFYPSITSTILQHGLSSAGVDDATVEPLAAWIDYLHGLPGVHPGLPVGVEASGPLATATLAGLDRVVRQAGFPFLRWADDYRCYVPSEGAAESVTGAAKDYLDRVGFELNDDKTRMRRIGEGRGGGGVSDALDEAAGPPRRLIDLAIERNPEGVTRSLGFLRYHQDPSGIDVLLDFPWMMDRFPKESCAYLSSAWGAISHEQKERLEMRLLEPTTVATAPPQMHLARLFRRGRHRVGPSTGEAVFAHGTALGVRQFGPTKAQYLALAGTSSERPRARRGRSFDLAETISDLDVKRGLIAGLRADGEINPQTRAGLDHLVRLDPDLAATRAWVEAA